MDILNDVFKEEFLYPMFDPHFETDEKWVVKPDIFNKEKFKQVKPQFMERYERTKPQNSGSRTIEDPNDLTFKPKLPEIKNKRNNGL